MGVCVDPLYYYMEVSACKYPDSSRVGFSDVPLQKLEPCQLKGSHLVVLCSDLMLWLAFGPYAITLFLYTSVLFPRYYFFLWLLHGSEKEFYPFASEHLF